MKRVRIDVSACPLQHSQHRTIFNFLRRRKTSIPQADSVAGPSNPVLEEFMRNKKTASATQPQQPTITPGDLAPTSIFDQVDQRTPTAAPTEPRSQPTPSGSFASVVLDPHPRARERWQRKMTIRQVQRGHRLTRTQFIKRTERESLSKSENIKTSIKKLGPLARQIAGKTVDDAITQMRFSNKKAAKSVLAHLESARDEAVLSRGMGIGSVETDDDFVKRDIRTKDGKRHKVMDMNQMYIAQAWVGRGPFGKSYDFRARGRTNVMRPPWTHLSLQLKEEATRVREFDEREAKRQRQRLQKTWVPLPDRPLIGQRQWYSW